MRWIFHTIPQPGEFAYDTWPPDAYKLIGGANAWAGVTVDVKNAMVFAATGSASFDFYGVNRHGDNLFANCVLALDARTGKRIWHFQGVRHDVWDWDFPVGAESCHRQAQRPPRRRRGAGHEVPAMSTCSIAKPASRSSRSSSARCRRRRFEARSSPTTQPYPAEAAAVHAPGHDRSHGHDADARSARGRPRALPSVRIGHVRAAHRTGRRGVSRIRRRRGMGRRGVRSRDVAAVRERERDAVDRAADSQQRHLALQRQLRHLPSRRIARGSPSAPSLERDRRPPHARGDRRASSAKALGECRRFPTWAAATSPTSRNS